MIACLVLYRRRAALDQSGGSTPAPNVHMFEMRVRIMTAPTFTRAKVIAAILFEGAMDGQAQEKACSSFHSMLAGTGWAMTTVLLLRQAAVAH